MPIDIVLIISLHGEILYNKDEDDIFNKFLIIDNEYKPFTKINAVTSGVCNLLDDKTIYDFIKILRGNFNKLENYNLENTNEVIKLLKENDPSLQLKTSGSMKLGLSESALITKYRERLDQGWNHFRINSIESNGSCRKDEICKYVEKKYVYVPGQTLQEKLEHDVGYLQYFLEYFNELFANIPEGTYDSNIEDNMNTFSNLLSDYLVTEEDTLDSTKWEGGSNSSNIQAAAEEEESEMAEEESEMAEEENILDMRLKNLYIYKLLPKNLRKLLDTFPDEIKGKIVVNLLDNSPIEKLLFSGTGQTIWDANYRDNSIIILENNGNEIIETDITNDVVKSSGNRAILYRKEKKDISSQREFYFSDILKYLDERYGEQLGNITIVDLACNYIEDVDDRTINALRREGRQNMIGFGKTKKNRSKSHRRRSVSTRTPTLLQQIKDNPWMKQILIKKANNARLSEYEQFLFNAMKQQPLPPGGMMKLLNNYKRIGTKKRKKQKIKNKK